MQLEDLRTRLTEFSAERDWDQFHNPKDLAVSVSIEAAELLELFQWLPSDHPLDEDMKASIESEVADVFLYLLILCEKCDINLIEVANLKMDHNEKRFAISQSLGIAKPSRS